MKTKIFILAAFSSTAMLSAAQMDQGRNTYQYQQNQQDSFKQTPRTIMDDEIAKNVHDALAGNWLSSGYPNVTFDVNNGTVNLRGVVENQDDKNKVEQTVKKIEGVRNVRSEITVGIPHAHHHHAHHHNHNMVSMNNNHNSTATSTAAMTKDTASTDKDRMINAKIREKLLKWNPRGYETLVFATSNGAVTITGNIERVEDIQKISADVRNTEGVKSITNQASIRRR